MILNGIFLFASLFSVFAFSAETIPTYSEVQALPERVKTAEANLCAPPSVGADGKPCDDKNAKPKTGASSVVAAAQAASQQADMKRELAFFEAYKTYGGYAAVPAIEITADTLKQELALTEKKLATFTAQFELVQTELAAYKGLSVLFKGSKLASPMPSVRPESLAIFRSEIQKSADQAASALKSAKLQASKNQFAPSDLALLEQYNQKAQAAFSCISKLAAADCKTPAVTSLSAVLTNSIADKESTLQNFKKYFNEAPKRIEMLKKQLADQVASEAQFAKTGPSDQQKLTNLEHTYEAALDKVENNSGFNNCGMSIGEQLAIAYYTSSGYRVLNGALRKGGEDLAKVQPLVDELNAALKHLKPFDGYVIRGASLPPAVKAEHTPGSIVTYAAFTSTSLTKGFSDTDRFVIHSRSGRYIGSLSSVYMESEVLFPSNTKFKVLEVKVEGVVTTYVMDEVTS